MSSRTSRMDFPTESVEMDVQVQGLQYRRNSSKDKLDNLVQIPLNDLADKENVEIEDGPDPGNPEEQGSYVPYAPDGGYGWVIAGASFLNNFVLDGISVSGGPLLSIIQEASGKTIKEGYNATGDVLIEKEGEKYEYGISVGAYSLIGSILLSVTLLVGPLISVMTNRWGFRAVSMAGSVVAAFGIFMSWACSPSIPNIWANLFFYGVVAGFGFGMMFQPSIIIVGMWFEKRRALATGIAICGTGVGSIVFPLMSSEVALYAGWQGAYLLQAGIALLSAGFAWFYRPLPIKFVKGKVRRTSVAIPSGEPIHSHWNAMIKTFKEMLPLCKSPTFLLLGIAGAVTMLGFYAPYAFIPDRAEEEFGYNQGKGGQVTAYGIGVTNTFARLLFGYLSDHPKMNILVLNNAALTLGGIVTIMSPFFNEVYQLYLYTVAFAIMIAIFAVLRSILILKFMGMENFNNAFGLGLLFMGITTLIGTPIGGALRDWAGHYDFSFYVAGVYFIVSAVMCYPLQCVSDWENGKKEQSVGQAGDTEKM